MDKESFQAKSKEAQLSEDESNEQVESLVQGDLKEKEKGSSVKTKRKTCKACSRCKENNGMDRRRRSRTF